MYTLPGFQSFRSSVSTGSGSSLNPKNISGGFGPGIGSEREPGPNQKRVRVSISGPSGPSTSGPKTVASATRVGSVRSKHNAIATVTELEPLGIPQIYTSARDERGDIDNRFTFRKRGFNVMCACFFGNETVC